MGAPAEGHVIIDSDGALTNTELRAVPVPVSGTFYQTTQPVSAASLPLPSGAATGAKQDTGNTSCASIDSKITACNTGAVVVSSSALPSGAATSALQTTLNGLLPASLGQKAMASALAVSVASDQSALPVTQATLTKGTQGANGVSTQDLKDAGRTLKTYSCTAIATVTSEALITLTPYADLVAGGGASTFAVTSGKRLRIQAINVTVRATSTVNVGGIIRFRLLAGTVLVGSPIHATLGCQASNLATAVIGNCQSYSLTFPDGLELSGTMQFGLTQLFSATTATIDVQVVGFEY